MASQWFGRGIGRGVRTREGLAKGRGLENRYCRSDYNVFSVLSDPTHQSETECENSDTEGPCCDTDGGDYQKVKRKEV